MRRGKPTWSTDYHEKYKAMEGWTAAKREAYNRWLKDQDEKIMACRSVVREWRSGGMEIFSTRVDKVMYSTHNESTKEVNDE